MKREELAHILRSARRIADDKDVLVVGSQAILGAYDEDDLPAPATASMDADIAFLNDPDRAKADQVEGAIGEMSSFHESYGVYAELGVQTIDPTVTPRTSSWSGPGTRSAGLRSINRVVLS